MQISQRSYHHILNFLSDSLYDTRAANFWLKKINPLWSTDEVLGQIVEKRPLAQDMMAIIIRCRSNMQQGQAGQHHPVVIEIDGRRYERSYSLTLLDVQHVQINVKKVPTGIVSTWLHEQAKIGDIIRFGQPYGDVTLENFQSKNLILLAAGSGITPIFSVLHHLHQQGQFSQYNICLYYWAKQHADFAFKAVFEDWQQQNPHFNVHFLCTQQQPKHARLNEHILNNFDHVENSSVFACGPSGFTQHAASVFKHAQQLQTEAFSLSPVTYDQQATVNITLTKSKQTL
ncbi:hypothetical protein GWI33_011466, partial [Rhynchophorus ferrugineus]